MWFLSGFPIKKTEKLPDGNSYQDYRLSPFVVPTNSVYCFNTIDVKKYIDKNIYTISIFISKATKLNIASFTKILEHVLWWISTKFEFFVLSIDQKVKMVYTLYNRKTPTRKNMPFQKPLDEINPSLTTVKCVYKSVELKGTRKCALYEQLPFLYSLKLYAPARDPCNSHRSSHGFTIFSWDSKFSILTKVGLANFFFLEMSSGIIKVNCYKYPWCTIH